MHRQQQQHSKEAAANQRSDAGDWPKVQADVTYCSNCVGLPAAVGSGVLCLEDPGTLQPCEGRPKCAGCRLNAARTCGKTRSHPIHQRLFLAASAFQKALEELPVNMDEDTAPDMTALAQRTGCRERAGVDLKKATLDAAQLKVTKCLASADIEGAKTARVRC